MIKKEKINLLMKMLEEKCNENIIKYFAKKHKKKLRMRFNTPTAIKCKGTFLFPKRVKRIGKQCNNKSGLGIKGYQSNEGMSMSKSILLSSSTSF